MEGLEGYHRKLPTYLADARVQGLLFFALFTVVIFFGYLLAAYPLGTDTLGMPTDILSFQLIGDFFTTWRWYTSLGHLNYPSPVIGTIYFLLAGVLHMNPLDVSKVLFALSFFMAGFFTYLLCLDLKARPIPSAIGGVIFCFNQVFMSQVVEGHFNMVLGCALVPLLFLFLIRLLNKQTYRSALWLGLIAFIYGSVASPNMVLIAAIVIPLFCLPYLFPLRWTTLRVAMVTGTVTVILILQTALFKFTDVGNSNLSTAYKVSQASYWSYNDIVQSLLLRSTENSYMSSSSFGSWVVPSALSNLAFLLSLSLPILAFYFIVKRRGDRLVAGMAIVLVFCTLISLGPNSFWGGLFAWGFNNIPYMDSVRVYSRFGMISALCYAVLIPLFLSSISSGRRYQYTMPWMKNVVIKGRWVRTGAAVILAGAMVLSASAAFFGFVGSFNLPSSYAEPYEYIHDEGGDYRYLTLPYGFLYYSNGIPRYDGYPRTVTLDPGIYSPLLTDGSFAYGVENENFWSTVHKAVEDRWFGYQDTMELVGATANVRYVVAQLNSQGGERETFQSLDGMDQTIPFPGGSNIYVNSAAQPHLYALSSMMVTTGGYRSLYTSMGAGVVDPSQTVVAFLGQEDQASKARLLEESNGIVLIDGDVFQFMVEYHDWGSMLKHLSDNVDDHAEDVQTSWVVRSSEMFNGLTWSSSAYTNSERPMIVSVDPEADRHVYIQAATSPQSGNFTVKYGGENHTFDLASAAYTSTWLDIGTLPDNVTSLEIVPQGDGEVILLDMLTAPEAELEAAREEAQDLLIGYQDKVVLLYPTYRQELSDGWFVGQGALGLGASDTLTLNVDKYTGRQGKLSFALGRSGSLASGPEYNLTIDLFTPNREVPCTLEVYSGVDLVASQTVLVSPGGLDRASMLFRLPEVPTDVSLTVRTGSDQIKVGTVNVAPTTGLPLDLGMSSLWNSSVNLSIIRSVTDRATPSVSLNGQALAIDTTGGNITAPGSMVQGENRLTMNVTQAYAVVVYPPAWSADHGAVNSSYEKRSTTDYGIDLEVNGTAIIILSESYHPLWTISGDAVGFKAYGAVNGYIVDGNGTQHHDIVFTGGDIYGNVLIRYLSASLIAIVALVIFPLPVSLVRRLLDRSR